MMNQYSSAEAWFADLQDLAAKHHNGSAVRDFEGWTEDWQKQSPAEAYYAEYPEHKPATEVKAKTPKGK